VTATNPPGRAADSSPWFGKSPGQSAERHRRLTTERVLPAKTPKNHRKSKISVALPPRLHPIIIPPTYEHLELDSDSSSTPHVTCERP
jgi:hypothetical protein